MGGNSISCLILILYLYIYIFRPNIVNFWERDIPSWLTSGWISVYIDSSEFRKNSWKLFSIRFSLSQVKKAKYHLAVYLSRFIHFPPLCIIIDNLSEFCVFLIHVFESRRKAFDNSRRGIRKGEKTSSPMQDGDASIPRDRGILTQEGFAELGKEKITLLDARGRSKSSSMYTGQSQMARVVKGASRVEEKFW